VKKPFKTLLEKQNGKSPNVAVDGNVFEISRRKKILRILVLQRHIIFWNRENFKTLGLKPHIVTRSINISLHPHVYGLLY